MSEENAVIEQDDFVEQVTAPEGDPKASVEKKEEVKAPSALETAMAELAGTVKSLATPKEKEEVLTQEQKDELWAVYNPTKTDPDFFRKFLRLNTDMDPIEVEKAVKEFTPLFAEMQKGMVRQSIVGARNILLPELQKLRDEFGPISEHVSQERAVRTRERFSDAYPALADPKFKKVLDASARAIATQEFKTEDDFFKALAESAAETIKGVLPEFDLGAKPAKQPATTTPRLPRTRAGGTGGTGGGEAAPKKDAKDDDSDAIDWA